MCYGKWQCSYLFIQIILQTTLSIFVAWKQWPFNWNSQLQILKDNSINYNCIHFMIKTFNDDGKRFCRSDISSPKDLFSDPNNPFMMAPLTTMAEAKKNHPISWNRKMYILLSLFNSIGPLYIQVRPKVSRCGRDFQVFYTSVFLVFP